MNDHEPKVPEPTGEGEVNPWALAGLGMQFAVALVFFGWAGNWLDARSDTSPLFLLVGVMGGAGGTFFLSYRRLTKPRVEATEPPTPSAGQ